MLILGVIGTGVALIINFQLIATEGATAASVVTYLVPAVALLLGVLVLDEPATLALPIGGALILAGVALTRARSLVARVAADLGRQPMSAGKAVSGTRRVVGPPHRPPERT